MRKLTDWYEQATDGAESVRSSGRYLSGTALCSRAER